MTWKLKILTHLRNGLINIGLIKIVLFSFYANITEIGSLLICMWFLYYFWWGQRGLPAPVRSHLIVFECPGGSLFPFNAPFLGVTLLTTPNCSSCFACSRTADCSQQWHKLPKGYNIHWLQWAAHIHPKVAAFSGEIFIPIYIGHSQTHHSNGDHIQLANFPHQTDRLTGKVSWQMTSSNIPLVLYWT